ncbi:MAG: hypothetical protein WC869_01355 [Phycisphaerae bacterium]|jgi:hypothetical protein
MSENKADYDVSYHWTRGQNTGWTTVGHAFINSKGRIKIYFHANPVPGLATAPGEFMLFPKSKPVQETAAAQTEPE